jgi:CheY-like chemotaxis protein
MSAKAAPVPRPLQILVAEDDPNDVLLLKRALAKAGIATSLYFVSSGQEVISYFQGEPPFEDRGSYPFPDILLLDIKMPGTSGLEVLEWFASQPKLDKLRIVVFSSCIAPEDLRHAKKLGAHACITKPLGPLDLMSVFRDLTTLPGSETTR